MTNETGSSGADRGYSSGTSAGSVPGMGLTRPTSETNLRQLAYGEGSSVSASLAARPGSALGLLQGSSIVNTNGMRTTAHLTSTTLTNSNSSVATNRPIGGLMTGFNTALNSSAAAQQVKSEDQALRESLAAILPPDLRHLVGAPANTSTATTSDTNTILNAVRQQRRHIYIQFY